MDPYEQLLAKRAYLEKLVSLTGQRQISPLLDLAALSGDSELARDIGQLLQDNVLLTQPSLHPFLPGPGDETLQGDVQLGSLLDGLPVMLGADDLTRHALIVGPTGSGKTTMAAGIVQQVVHGATVWIFDAHAEYHRFLADEIRSGLVLVLDVPRGDVKRSLLEVLVSGRREDPKAALARISALLRRTMFIRDGGENIFREACHQLYVNHGIFEGSEDYPTLEELLEHLSRLKRRLPPRELEYWSSLWNRLNALGLQMPETYGGVVSGFSIPELLHQSIIFRTVGMNTLFYRFFVDDLLTCALTCRRLDNAS